MYERFLRVFHSQGFIERAGHVVQFEHGHILAPCHPAHGVGIIFVRLFYLSVFIERAALGRCDEYRNASLRAYFIYKRLQLGGKEVIGAFSRAFQFLVVVPELDEHIVARLHLAQRFFQPSGLDERVRAFSALCVVGKADTLIEEAGNHLPPACPWLVVLVYYGRVSGKEYRRDVFYPFDFQTCQTRSASVKLERKLVVPVQLALFALLDLHFLFSGYEGIALVDGKGIGLELSFACGDVFQEQTPGFSAYGGDSGLFLAS